MLESYYVRPQAVGRIRASWIGSEIECYVVWLAEQSYSRASVRVVCRCCSPSASSHGLVVPGPLAIYQLMSRRS
jgi:hypothetical protein